jgi:hypothetical protein
MVEAEDGLCQAQTIHQHIGAIEASAISAELDELRGTSQPTSIDSQDL